jgi:glycerol uptake facilitator-like aquaporin
MPHRSALTAEFLGTLLLVTTVVGSGIMAQSLAGGNTAIALLGNTLPTGAILVVLISIFGPVSGAHFNPVVSTAMAVMGHMPRGLLLPFVFCQIAGGIAGTWLAHLMFDLPVLQVSTTIRWGAHQWLAEGVATFGLLLVIYMGLRNKSANIATLVGLYITAAYWFTSSTSFANPAVTIARSLTNTFSGIAPTCVVPFIAAQIAGAVVAVIFAKKMLE